MGVTQSGTISVALEPGKASRVSCKQLTTEGCKNAARVGKRGFRPRPVAAGFCIFSENRFRLFRTHSRSAKSARNPGSGPRRSGQTGRSKPQRHQPVQPCRKGRQIFWQLAIENLRLFE